MKLKFNNIPNLDTLKASDDFKKKCKELLITNCNKINAKALLDQIIEYQRNLVSQGILTEINIDRFNIDLPYDSETNKNHFIGHVDDLYKYVLDGFRGIDINGSNYDFPIFNGTWTIDEYIDKVILDTLREKFGPLMVFDTPFFVDWDNVAIQTLDSTKPNYNPAAAIVLYNNGIGNAVDNAQKWQGRYILSKDEAAKIYGLNSWFKGITEITDDDMIVGSFQDSYIFSNFDELQNFTGLSQIDISAFSGCNNVNSIIVPRNVTEIKRNAFCDCSNLKNVTLPSSLKKMGDGIFQNDTELKTATIPNGVTHIGSFAYKGCSNVELSSLPNGITEINSNAFDGCEKITIASIPMTVTEIGDAAFNNCKNITISKLPEGITSIKHDTFNNCDHVNITEIPENVSYVGSYAFNGCNEIQKMRIKNPNMIKIEDDAFNSDSNYDIFVGSEDSSIMTHNLLDDYMSDTKFGQYNQRIKSYFTEYYKNVIPSDYELQDYIISDGKMFMDSTAKYESGIKFAADVKFLSPSDNSYSVHGSNTIGLKTNKTEGIKASVGGSVVKIDDYNEKSANYQIDIKNSELKKNNKTIFKSSLPTAADNSKITFFGDSSSSFIGVSWMNKIYKDNILVNDFIPVKRKSDNKVGFYDVKNNKFIDGNGYSSDTIQTTIETSTNVKLTDENGNVIVFG